MTQITIEVSRTVQVAQYEPVTVKVTQQVQVADDEDEGEARDRTYAAVTKSVKRYIDNEVAKYSAGKKK